MYIGLIFNIITDGKKANTTSSGRHTANHQRIPSRNRNAFTRDMIPIRARMDA